MTVTQCDTAWLEASPKIRTCKGHFPCLVPVFPHIQGYIEEPGNSAAVLGSQYLGGNAVRHVMFFSGWELVGVPWKPVVTGCCSGQLCLNVAGEGKPPFVSLWRLIWGDKAFLQGRANVIFSDFVLLPESQRSDESYKPEDASLRYRAAKAPLSAWGIEQCGRVWVWMGAWGVIELQALSAPGQISSTQTCIVLLLR